MASRGRCRSEFCSVTRTSDNVQVFPEKNELPDESIMGNKTGGKYQERKTRGESGKSYSGL